MTIKALFSLSVLMLSVTWVTAQTKQQEYIRVQEQIKKTYVLQQLDSGVYLMNIGNYAGADDKFIYALNNSRSVPSDLTFYFGKNSFYLGKYKQSIDWLNKYIQLKGTNGQFSTDAVALLKRAEEEYLKAQITAEKKTQEIRSTSYDIDCGPSGKVTCPVCKGDHVIVKKGAFNDEYKTCPYCDEHGVLTCEQYNNLLRGELKPKI